MAPQKTRALVLKVFPYRESSSIAYLFTENHGLVHGIARGVRGRKGGGLFFERGFLLELLVYHRPHRDLHTLSGLSVLEAYERTRGSLLKTTVRDIAFEVALSAITVSDPHPELFDFFDKFLGFLEQSPEDQSYPFALWRYLHRFPALLGFGLDLESCMSCGATLPNGGVLDLGGGGLECESCSRGKGQTGRLSGEAIRVIGGIHRDIKEISHALEPNQVYRTTVLLADFCRYHFDARDEYRSLTFLRELGD